MVLRNLKNEIYKFILAKQVCVQIRVTINVNMKQRYDRNEACKQNFSNDKYKKRVVTTVLNRNFKINFEQIWNTDTKETKPENDFFKRQSKRKVNYEIIIVQIIIIAMGRKESEYRLQYVGKED
eukprot:TRINITY_DN13599_c0_g1_i2.p3 TRINITY_DN13599_c0_g1~~TRINITY_DN13599_c0_g1_i2.p3  ORF type:complete len:124 (+),score=3.29 TRINITY_DN13599_c0_g1_i2:235-606(+)